jgi:predicted dehydrogenase
MQKTINWGILGTGKIANIFAMDLKKIPDAKLIAVGSRSKYRASEFAKKFNAEHFYGSYSELVNDSEVDVVYIATPHPLHKENTILCLQHGKAVLCEKPIAINEREAQEMVACARKNNLFLMEAMWTRFLPVIKTFRQWLQDKRIGKVRLLIADFGFRAEWNPQGRLLNPALAGGALLDVGIYTVSLASMIFGSLPYHIRADSYLGKTGVDEQTAIILKYEQGELALLSCAICTNTSQDARIYGTKGMIYIPQFWRASTATLQINGQAPMHSNEPSGYHYEAMEVISCLRAGEKESKIITLDESIAIMRIMDQIRAQIGLGYPMESV